MKRVVGIILFLCAVIAALLIFSPSKDQKPVARAEVASENPQGTTPLQSAAKTRPRAAKGDASAQAPAGPVVHTAADFQRGEIQNLKIVDGTLQLGDDPRFVPRFRPDYKHFGIYMSPEQAVGDSFDIVVPSYEATPFKGNEVTFEFRTRSADLEWSTWYQLTKEPGTAMPLENGAVSWQYRMTFFANDPAKSPQVRSVSMTAKKTEVQPDPGANFSASNGR